MALDDLFNKAKSALGNDKVQDALKSDKAEDISDRVLDGAEGAAGKLGGGKFDGQISGARDAADKHIGTE